MYLITKVFNEIFNIRWEYKMERNLNNLIVELMILGIKLYQIYIKLLIWNLCAYLQTVEERIRKSFPGIKIVSLLKKVEKFLDGNDQSNNKIIYIFAGVNDLTLDREQAHNYKE